MPVSRRGQSPAAPVVLTSDVPTKVYPYLFHGVDLVAHGSHWVGDCPFCNKSSRTGKFSVDADSGLWRCFVCGSGTDRGGGNALVFLRLLHDMAVGASRGRPGEASPLAGAGADRGLDVATLHAWGVALSPRDGSWLVPGYGADGALDQLYKRVWSDGAWKLYPTTGVWPEGKAHALHLPVNNFDPNCDTVYICEGPWDGMALWEAMHKFNVENCQVIAVPGCNVWRDDWTAFCRNKHVLLMFDSDHPRVQSAAPAAHENDKVFRAGYDGMKRVAKKLAGTAASVQWLCWGEDGYDPDRPTGWDVRDHLSSNEDRRSALIDLFTKMEGVPLDWGVSSQSTGGTTTDIETRDCSTWQECESAWCDAMHWRQDMSDALAVILAVCASTNQGGNQLFLDVVGSPGIAKTTIMRGVLVSKHCIQVENITKILSGYKKKDNDGADCSFLARANKKTWITCEFDTILTSYQYVELMGKMRRIFDGETSSTYGNTDEDRIYSALRTPWIRGGTWKMMDTDQSQLGDRFLRIIINDPSESEKRNIMRAALRSERMAMLESVNCTAGSLFDPKTRLAYSLTGGYVDWLRANVEDLLPTVEARMSVDAEEHCMDLAELSADMRARPNEDKKKKENNDGKELPTRLIKQYIRLASHLAVILNKNEVDRDVLRIVRKVALDTAHGHTLNIAKWMCSLNPRGHGKSYHECGGLMDRTLQMWTGMTPDRLENYMNFLRKIDVVDWNSSEPSGAWVLTERMHDLYMRVMRY